MKELALKLLEYLKYPSTYKGIISLLGVIGVSLAPDLQEQIIQACIAVVGVIWLLFSDSDVKKPE